MNCEDTTSKLSVSLKITKVLGVGKCVGLFMLSAWNQITQATLSNSTSVIGRGGLPLLFNCLNYKKKCENGMLLNLNTIASQCTETLCIQTDMVKDSQAKLWYFVLSIFFTTLYFITYNDMAHYSMYLFPAKVFTCIVNLLMFPETSLLIVSCPQGAPNSVLKPA